MRNKFHLKQMRKPVMFGLCSLSIFMGCMLFLTQYIPQHWAFHVNASQQVLKELATKPPQTGVLVFYKPGCRHCQQVEPTVSRAKQQAKDKTYLINVQQPQARTWIQKYGVTRTPTFIKLKGGQVIDVYQGTQPMRIQRLFDTP